MKPCKELADRRLTISTILLVFYSIPFSMAVGVASTIIRTMLPSGDSYAYVSMTVEPVVLSFGYPVVGWVVDVIIGRDSAISVSIVISWLGILLQVVSCTLQYYFFGVPDNYFKYCLSGISLILVVFGTVLFFSAFLSYGMDQLIYGSSAKMRAFIHWIAWGIFVGYFVRYMHFTTNKQVLTIGTNVCVFGFLTMALVLHIFLKKDMFIPTGQVKDTSYKMVLSIWRYAFSHKYPQSRSAFSRWQQDHPGRIDLAKSRYGGPFNDDSVENTKTFMQVALLFLAFFGIYMPYATVWNIYTAVLQYSRVDLFGYGMPLLYTSADLLIVIMVPLFELVVIPIYPKIEFFLKPLVLLILSNIFMIATLTIMIVLEITGTVVYHKAENCIDDYCFNKYSISYFWYALVFVFTEITSALNIIGAFGFICSQAPSSLVGMLTTTFWFIKGMYTTCGSLLPMLFVYSAWKVWRLGDVFWIIVVQLIVSILGFLVLIFACKRYKKPSRGNSLSSHVVIENNFEKILCSSTETACDEDILEIMHPGAPLLLDNQRNNKSSQHSIQNELIFNPD